MPRKKTPPPAPPPLTLTVGGYAEVANLSGIARIAELDPKRNRARVELNGHTISTTLDKLKPSAPPPDARPSNLVRVVGRSAMQYEIDLHGLRVEEAIETADRAIDQAVINHLETFRIIHGHGTGALRKAIRELLSKHPHVTDYRFGEPHEGGLACTVATLRKMQK